MINQGTVKGGVSTDSTYYLYDWWLHLDLVLLLLLGEDLCVDRHRWKYLQLLRAIYHQMLSEYVSSAFGHQRRISKSLWKHFNVRFLWSAIALYILWQYHRLRSFFDFIIIQWVSPWWPFLNRYPIYLCLHGRLSLKFRRPIVTIVRWKPKRGRIACIDQLSRGLMMHESGRWSRSYGCRTHFHRSCVLTMEEYHVLLGFLSERELHLMLSAVKGWGLVVINGRILGIII